MVAVQLDQIFIIANFIIRKGTNENKGLLTNPKFANVTLVPTSSGTIYCLILDRDINAAHNILKNMINKM